MSAEVPGTTKSCPMCGEQIQAAARKCRFCGEVFDPALRAAMAPKVDPALKALIPIGRSPLSIAAGYLGLFSLLPLFGIVSIIVSWLALRELNRKPELSGRGRAIFGLVMGIVFTVLYFVPCIISPIINAINR